MSTEEETKLQKMIREYCEDRTPLLPPGIPRELLGLSEAQQEAIDQAGTFAESGEKLGQILGEMAGRVLNHVVLSRELTEK